MVGAKIPVLEIEKFKLSKSGRGFIVPDDGTNLWVGGWVKPYMPSQQNASGWFKIHYTSGSTYGPTGMTAYVPFYSRTA